MKRPTRELNLGNSLTQEQFGELVGISQQAVSDLQLRGVIAAGQNAGAWLRAYCDHLRASAAARDGDSPLAAARTRLASEQADRIERQNAASAEELLPAALIERALADVKRQLVAALDALPARVRSAFPELSAEASRIVESQVAAMRATAIGARLSHDGEPDDASDEEDLDPRRVLPQDPTDAGDSTRPRPLVAAGGKS